MKEWAATENETEKKEREKAITNIVYIFIDY